LPKLKPTRTTGLMRQRAIANRMSSNLPKLAATALICCTLVGANSYLDSAKPVASVPEFADATTAQLSGDIPALKVLSAKDAGHYLTIFTAQEKGDWKSADATIAKLGDHRLLGHVLADRYMRKPASAAELKGWLEKYADLPEAGYLRAQAIALAGPKGEIPAPVAGTWTGSDNYGASFGFRAAGSIGSKPTSASRRFAAKFNSALHRNKPADAENLLTAEERRHGLTSGELAKAQGLVAASFFYDGKIAQARHLADAGAKQQNILALWIDGLTAWKQRDLRASGNAFALLAAQENLSSWDRAAADFWAWRALRSAGDKNAHFWLEQAARQPRSFYGLMAASLLGNDHDGWSWELPTLDKAQVSVLAAQKAGGRALALLQIGKRAMAESELRHLNPQGRRDLQEAMLAFASAEHMPSLALQLGGVATRANGTPYDAALYPLPPWQPAEGFQIDPALLYALMRHESQFDPLAMSGRGACGLMQLLPATAKLMAYGKDDHTAADCSGNLLDPAVNMALGQKYMIHLASQPIIGDNLLLLLAAYNSGPSKLAHWMSSDEDKAARKHHGHASLQSRSAYEKTDPLYFLENLPLRQTHDYVEQVLIHYWIYQARLGESEGSLTTLAHGQWPRLAPPEDRKPLSKGMKEAALPAAGLKVASNLK